MWLEAPAAMAILRQFVAILLYPVNQPAKARVQDLRDAS